VEANEQTPRRAEAGEAGEARSARRSVMWLGSQNQ